MVGAKRLLIDRERALVERFGLRVLALGGEEKSQVVQGEGHVRVVGAAVLLCGPQCLPREKSRALVLTGAIQLGRLFIEDFPLGPAAGGENVGREKTKEQQGRECGHCRKVQTGLHSLHLPTSRVGNQPLRYDGTKKVGVCSPGSCETANPCARSGGTCEDCIGQCECQH